MKNRLAPLLAAALAAAAPLRAQTAEDGLALGIRQVQEGDFREAVRTLEDVARELSGDKTKSKQLARAYVYTAIAYVGLSQEEAAKSKFLEAWRNDTALRLSPREFPPRVIRAFEAALVEIRNVPQDPALVNAFLEAAKSNDVAGLHRLLDTTPALLYAKEPQSGATALHWATLRGHTLATAYLVGAGADLTATNSAGEMPSDVARRSKRETLLPWLQFPGVGAPAVPGEVFEAAKRGDVGRLRQILAADPQALDQKDPDFGATPLHFAALKGYPATVAFLLGAGADPAATNLIGETPLLVAQRAGKVTVVPLLGP
jgi:hypothetical protein